MPKLLLVLLLLGAGPCAAQPADADTTGRLLGLPLINQVFPSRLPLPDTSTWSPLQRYLLRVSSKNTGGCLSALKIGLLDSAGNRYMYQRLAELATALYQAGTPLLLMQGYNAGSEAIYLNRQGNVYGITYYGNSLCDVSRVGMNSFAAFNHVTYKLTGYAPEPPPKSQPTTRTWLLGRRKR